MLELAALPTAPKQCGSFDRCVSLESTLALAPVVRKRFGITRVAEITHLDRIGIPVMCAIVPASADAISIYNGKGLTRAHALAGALMEAVERQSAAVTNVASFIVDARREPALIAPAELGVHRRWRGPRLEVVPGIDLVTDDAVLVPLAAVRTPWRGERVLQSSSTNGLAAGNTPLEAIYHALCELIERHVWSIAHARAHVRPLNELAQFAGGQIALSGFVDDPIAWEIPFPSGCATVDRLAERVARAGLVLRVRAVELAPFPILVTATIADEQADPGCAHMGLGASLSPEHAAVRAITEAAQARASDFQAAREDALLPDDPTPFGGDHNRRRAGVPSGRWYYDAPAPAKALTAFDDRSSDDLAVDVRALVAALRAGAVGRVAVVDLSPGEIPVHVVRVIAPGLETTIFDGRIGPAVARVLDLRCEPLALPSDLFPPARRSG